MLDDFRRIAQALGVSERLLVGAGLGGFALLLLVATTKDTAVGVVSAVFGACVTLVGARAIVRPSRPFAITSLRKGSGLEYLNTTRRLGGFYILAGLVWIMVSLIVTQDA
jgi:hypothetical protein